MIASLAKFIDGVDITGAALVVRRATKPPHPPFNKINAIGPDYGRCGSGRRSRFRLLSSLFGLFLFFSRHRQKLAPKPCSGFLPRVLQAYSENRNKDPSRAKKDDVFVAKCEMRFSVFQATRGNWRTQYDLFMNNLEIAGILHVDDSEDDRFLFKRAWQRAGIHLALVSLTSGEQAIDYLAGNGEYADRSIY